MMIIFKNFFFDNLKGHTTVTRNTCFVGGTGGSIRCLHETERIVNSPQVNRGDDGTGLNRTYCDFDNLS